MAKSFNPKLVLRQLSNPLLQAFFEHRGHPLPVPWARLSTTQVNDIFDAWQKLPDEKRRAVEVVFHDVQDMACDDGMQVIIEEGVRRGENLSFLLDGMASRCDVALWTFMHRRNIWDAAVRFARADSLCGGRSWVKRGNMPAVSPQVDGSALHEFQMALSAFYRERQGRGHHCRAEHFWRGPDLHYIFVYLSDYADTYINFTDTGLFQRTPERRAFEVMFVYDSSARTLETYAKGGKRVVEPLQRIFSRILLGQPLPEEQPGEHPYRLDKLMERGFGFPTDPEDGVVGVRIRALRLSVLGRKRSRITLEPDPEDAPERIWDLLEEGLDRRNLPKSILQVTKATINMTYNDPGRRRSLTFDVTYPNGCTLRSKRDDQRRLGEKYLRRWKIDVA